MNMGDFNDAHIKFHTVTARKGNPQSERGKQYSSFYSNPIGIKHMTFVSSCKCADCQNNEYGKSIDVIDRMPLYETPSSIDTRIGAKYLQFASMDNDF